MRKISFVLLIMIFLLSACGQSTTVPVIDDVTPTPSLTPTSTSTPLPSATPTASITALPTIPTFTPTFDVSTIVTVTPASSEECPQRNSGAKLDRSVFQDYPENSTDNQIQETIFEYLNAGGSMQIANSELQKNNKYGYPFGSISEVDLTNDDTNEFVITVGAGFGIYSCKAGLYELLLNLNGITGEPALIVAIRDMNLNGIPEIVAGIKYCSGHCIDISIFEWNGREFQSLIEEWKTISSYEEGSLDINGDGIFELVIEGPFASMGSYTAYVPLRGQKDIYFWNGKNYSMARSKYSLPVYRFQSIQDADAESSDGNLEAALHLYERTIFDKELEWWSIDRREYEIKLYLGSWDATKPTPPSEPSEDTSEYPRLAAYAYYRIMLLHLVQGQESEALTTYNTLQQTFGNDPSAHPYVEMATAFWEAYQSTHRMYDGCAAAIQYAVEHPEILIPLGSDYHGWQSHIYVPADVCPFR